MEKPLSLQWHLRDCAIIDWRKERNFLKKINNKISMQETKVEVSISPYVLALIQAVKEAKATRGLNVKDALGNAKLYSHWQQVQALRRRTAYNPELESALLENVQGFHEILARHRAGLGLN